MKRVILKKEYMGETVALIHWEEKSLQPYVVAWGVNENMIVNGEFVGSWGQGHYFSNIDNAVKYYANHYDEESAGKIKFKTTIFRIDENSERHTIKEYEIRCDSCADAEYIAASVIDSIYEDDLIKAVDNYDYKLEEIYY